MQVHAAHGKGMGPKAMLLLAGLAQEAELLHVLRSLLQPPTTPAWSPLHAAR